MYINKYTKTKHVNLLEPLELGVESLRMDRIELESMFLKTELANLSMESQSISQEGLKSFLRNLFSSIWDKMDHIDSRLARLFTLVNDKNRQYYDYLSELSDREFQDAVDKLSAKDFDKIRKYFKKSGRPSDIAKDTQTALKVIFPMTNFAKATNFFKLESLFQVTLASWSIYTFEIGSVKYSYSMKDGGLPGWSIDETDVPKGKLSMSRKDFRMNFDNGMIMEWFQDWFTRWTKENRLKSLVDDNAKQRETEDDDRNQKLLRQALKIGSDVNVIIEELVNMRAAYIDMFEKIKKNLN